MGWQFAIYRRGRQVCQKHCRRCVGCFDRVANPEGVHKEQIGTGHVGKTSGAMESQRTAGDGEIPATD